MPESLCGAATVLNGDWFLLYLRKSATFISAYDKARLSGAKMWTDVGFI